MNTSLRSRWSQWLALITLTVLGSACAVPNIAPAALGQRQHQAVQPNPNASTIKVYVTQQGHNLRTPWQKLAPNNAFGLGALLEGGKVLVTANLVQDARFIELERPNQSNRILARVVTVDDEANLALLEPVPPAVDFLSGLVPLRVMPVVKEGIPLDIWQMARGGAMTSSTMAASKVYVGRYLTPNSSLLLLQANGILRPEINSVTLPVVHDGQLAGMLMAYDARVQSATIIPGAIIYHFLRDASDGPYQGFPTVGLGIHATVDPHFRSYLGLEPNADGVYVGAVTPGGSGAAIGIEVGDILVKVDGQGVDNTGQVRDAVYGQVQFTNLLSGERYVGDKVKVEVLRKGKLVELEGPLVRKDQSADLVPDKIGSEGPNYLIHGGLVFQELTLPYLASFGEDWANNAPVGLAQVAREPGPLKDQGLRRVVFLAGVLPMSGTQGYEELFSLRVTRVNGAPVIDMQSLQRALATPVNGLQKIEFDDVPRSIVLDEAQAQIDNRVLSSSDYNIAQLSRISAAP